MMKLFVATLISLNILQVLARNKEVERDLMVKLLTECKTEEGGSDDDVEKLMRIEFPETREGKCILACGYNKIGIVSLFNIYLNFIVSQKRLGYLQFLKFDNGKFSRDTFLYIAGMVIDNDPVKMQFAGVTADKCGDAEGERCEQAFIFTKCLHEAVALTHIDIDIV